MAGHKMHRVQIVPCVMPLCVTNMENGEGALFLVSLLTECREPSIGSLMYFMIKP